MSETNIESSTTDSPVVLSETSSLPVLPSSSPSNTVDDETKRRKILSKLWGKGNKLSHKVRELEKSATNNGSDTLIHNDNDQQQLTDNSNNLSSYSSTNDAKSTTEDNSNSINSSKPLAVVKPIVVVKSGLIVSPATDRTRINSEASSTTITQIDENTITTTVTERQSSSSTTTTDKISSKKKKSHKNEDSKKKKATRDKSNERDRSKERHHHHHHHHKKDENSSKKDNASSSKTDRREHNEEISVNDNHHKSSRDHLSSTTSASNSRRRSRSNDADHSNRKSSRSTTSKKEEPSSSKRSTLSPVDHHSRHSSSKYETSSHRHRHGSSKTPSPPSSRSRYSTTKRDHSPRKTSLSPKKDDRNSTTTRSNRQQTESVSNSKSHNSISPSNHRHKSRTSNENLTNSSKSQKVLENTPDHRSSISSTKHEKSKITTNNDENSSNRRKLSSSHHDRRSRSRHRSRSKEDKSHRKTLESTNSEENSVNKTKSNHEKDSTTIHENSHHDKKSSRDSSVPSTHDDHHRRKSASDYHRYDRHDSPSDYDRRNYYYDDDRHHHRDSYYSKTHYVHHHHHHHYRSTSSRYHHHRRSISPHSRHPPSRYFSSSSSSLSPSPRRRSPSRTSSSSSSRSSSSYSSISRTSSSRSSSRNNHHYYHHRHHREKNFRRSPTLEKLFLKASESIESVSTQKNPNISSSTHLIPIQTSNSTSDSQLSLPMNSLSESNAFYAESFTGFSAPPPPFIPHPQQRYLKEITTDSSTSRRSMLNEIPLSTSSNVDEVTSTKIIQSNDLSSNVRSGMSKPPRISRFSDITPSVTSEPPLNTNLPVDTTLNYAQINENINCLPSARRQQKRHNREVMECECTTSEYDRSRGIKACGHECLNRMLLIECSSICPCGQWCTNRRFQRRSYANHKLALFKTEMKGFGLRTISSIRKGRFLVEYIGEVIDMDELGRRNKKYKRDGNIHQYVMSLIHGTVIDSTIKGNWARFINHSCEPNCVAEKWLVNGEYRMGIFAKRDLDVNEEITIDYRFETFGTVDLASEKCYCGAPTCRGTISVKKNNNVNNNNNLNKRQNRRQALDDDELLDYLHDDETNEYIIPKTIEEIRQLIQIMSRTDSENVRIIELDLIKNGSQKHFELPRLFLECNGLHVLCSWMKDILIEHDVDEQQQYSNEFKYHLLDFIHTVLPIKDRTIVSKNGLLDLVYKKLKLPLTINENIENNDQEQINNLMNSILNHLDDPIIAKLFHIYSTWMSLKERYIIPKRKESQQPSNHHHHHRHHHHHSSKHSHENNYRSNFSTRSSIIQPKSIERYSGKRSYVVRDIPRTQEQQLSKDERRKLFEQQYEDEEKARAAATAAATNGESPGGQNEPPHKKQRTSDGTEAIVSNTPPQSQNISMSYPHEIDHIHSIHRHLSQIPIEYIRSYMTSIGESVSGSSISTGKDELSVPPLPPPARPDDEKDLSSIIHLPSGWSVAMCPSDSSVYFYNQQTMTTSWIPPSLEVPTDESGARLDLSPLSSAQISEQRRPHHSQQLSSSSRSTLKLLKHPHRHSRSHRHHHHYNHHPSSSNKRKRPTEMDSATAIKDEPHLQSTEDTSMIILNGQEEINDKKSVEHIEETSDAIPKVPSDDNNEMDESTTVKELSEMNENNEEQTSSNNNTLSSSFKLNRDLLRKNISQHVHATLKPYTKRTCKQGRIVSTDDIKYLVKKFTLAVLDKEIEKAKNEGIPLSTVLTDRVRLKTEVYVKKYMNKMGSVFQRHDTVAHSSSQSSQPTTTTTTTTSNTE